MEIEQLIQGLEDGSLTEIESERLVQRMKDDAGVRRQYLEHMELVSLLQRTAKMKGESGTLPVSDFVLLRQKRRVAVMSVLSGLAALIMLGVAFHFYQLNSRGGGIGDQVFMEASYDAILEVKNLRDEVVDEAGQIEKGERVVLKQGVVRLSLPRGVEAIVEGPTELEVVSIAELRMHGGAGWFRVPSAGRGFTVHTDRGKVIDLGTEFGLRFDSKDRLQVHVARGSVRVDSKLRTGEDCDLYEGQAMALDPYGRAEQIDLGSEVFRRQFSYSMPYVHWSFDSARDGAFEAKGNLPGVSGYEARLKQTAASKVVGIEASTYLTDGKFGQALSLSGDGVFAESAFRGMGENTPRSFAAWIRHRKNCQSEVLSPYCSWGTREVGKLWQVSVLDSGKPRVSLMGAPLNLVEKPSGVMGEWVHLAVVYTGEQTEAGHPDIRIYLNGEEVAVDASAAESEVMTDILSEGALPVRFGASIANVSGKLSVDGDLDEVYLFFGVLNQAQIRSLMDANPFVGMTD
ncbi:LamG-like jellyroll fold domain-containing protein [Rubritalea tangerina]|uniref:LamG-like jellyroll fold domain-containing protein n=1 Tax=Rubritalea tangerina TaxID=430798 RepID=A0ABW4ZET9_9BACT